MIKSRTPLVDTFNSNSDDNSPAYAKQAFKCPQCKVYALHIWHNLCLNGTNQGTMFKLSICLNCDANSIWNSIHYQMIYPAKSTAPLPAQDMPDKVKEIYTEARHVHTQSPRAAAALLRVALEVLTEELGETEGSLNKRISNLKSKGLPDMAIKCLDSVRITANEGGVHAGEIELTGKDGPEIVNALFTMVNMIVEKTITEPTKLNKFYNSLPKNKTKGIEDRDKDNNQQGTQNE